MERCDRLSIRTTKDNDTRDTLYKYDFVSDCIGELASGGNGVTIMVFMLMARSLILGSFFSYRDLQHAFRLMRRLDLVSTRTGGHGDRRLAVKDLSILLHIQFRSLIIRFKHLLDLLHHEIIPVAGGRGGIEFCKFSKHDEIRVGTMRLR